MVLSSVVRESPWTSESIATTIARAMADYRSRVGARLRELREARDLSQEDAAHDIGVTTKTLSRWENGQRWPKPDHWNAIKRFYEADPREGIPSPGPMALSAPRGEPEPFQAADPTIGRLEEQLAAIQDLLEAMRLENAARDLAMHQRLDEGFGPAAASQ